MMGSRGKMECVQKRPIMSGLESLVAISWHLGLGSKVLSSLLMSELKMKLIKRLLGRMAKNANYVYPYFILRIIALNYSNPSGHPYGLLEF